MALAEQSYTPCASVNLVYLTLLTRGGALLTRRGALLTRGGTFLFDGDLVFCN